MTRKPTQACRSPGLARTALWLAVVGSAAAGLPAQGERPGTFVFGQVVDAEGNPVAGAEVESLRNPLAALPLHALQSRSDPLVAERQVVADERGRFVLPVERFGQYGLVARRPGASCSRVVWPVTAGQVVRITAHPVRARTGRVLAARTRKPAVPVAGARVYLASVPERNLASPVGLTPHTRFFRREVRSDPDGWFAFTTSGAEDGMAFARDGGRTAWSAFGKSSSRLLLVMAAQRASGKVVDLGGRPVRGAEVSWRGVPLPPDVITGADGRFTIPRAAECDRLVVTAPGRGRTAVRMRVGERPRHDPYRVVVATKARLKLRLLRADGTALAEARVLVHVYSPDDWLFSSWNETATDSDGRLALGCAQASRSFAVWVRLPETWVPLCRVSGHRDVDLGDVRVAPVLRVQGTVADVDGSPAAGASVFYHPIDRPESVLDTREVYTDVAGRFELGGMLPGRYRICSFSRRSRLAVAEVKLSPRTEPVALELEPARLIRGQVVGLVGGPRAGAVVYSMLDENDPYGLQVNAVTGADGRFALPCIHGPGKYALCAVHHGNRLQPMGHGTSVRVGEGDVEVVLR